MRGPSLSPQKKRKKQERRRLKLKILQGSMLGKTARAQTQKKKWKEQSFLRKEGGGWKYPERRRPAQKREVAFRDSWAKNLGGKVFKVWQKAGACWERSR